MAKRTKAEEKKLDAQIDTLFRQRHSGVQINMMEIPALFATARKAYEEGGDMAKAIDDFVATHRKN